MVTAGSHCFLKPDVKRTVKELKELCSLLGIPLEFGAIKLQMENIHEGIFGCREGEALIINSTLYLQNLPDDSVVRFSPRDKLLKVHFLASSVSFGPELTKFQFFIINEKYLLLPF